MTTKEQISKALNDFELEQFISDRQRNYTTELDLRNARVVLKNWTNVVQNNKSKNDKSEKFQQGVFVMVRILKQLEELQKDFKVVQQERDYVNVKNEMLEVEIKQYEIIKEKLPELLK